MKNHSIDGFNPLNINTIKRVFFNRIILPDKNKRLNRIR